MPATPRTPTGTTRLGALLALTVALTVTPFVGSAPAAAAPGAATAQQISQQTSQTAVQSAERPGAKQRKKARKARRARRAHWAAVRRVRRAQGIAMAQRGDRYGYGAAGPNAFDCSGLIYYSFRRAGFRGMPRTSSAQAGHVRRIPKSAMRRGDLMFFTGGGGVYHAGIFAGRGRGGSVRMLHSSRPGTPVQVSSPWTSSWFAGTMRPRRR